MLRRLMSFTRLILRMHLCDLRSLKSEEDRRMYLDHVSKEHGESYALDLVRMLGISFQLERSAHESSSEVFDQAYQQVIDTISQDLQQEDTSQETLEALEEEDSAGKMNIRRLLAYKQDIEEDIKQLEQLRPAA